MSRLPTPGSDAGAWGDILNEYLSQAHKADGTLKDGSVGSTQIQANAVTNNIIAPGAVNSASIAAGAVTSSALAINAVNSSILANGAVTSGSLNITAGTAGQVLTLDSAAPGGFKWTTPTVTSVPVTSVAGKIGDVTLAKADVGLTNVDNTSDADKPVSTATQTALDGKVAKAGDTMTGDLTFQKGSAATLGTGDNQALNLKTNGTTKLTVLANGNVSTTGTVSTTVGGAAGAGTQTLASNLYIQARGQNLVTNGSGLLLNNYNFSGFTFDSTETHGGGGSFKKNVAQQSAFNDELIPVNPEKYYRLIGWGKSGDTGGANYNATNRQYLGLVVCDIDGLSIQPYHYAKYPGSTDTTLAAPLNNGDTTITLTNATGWHNGATGHARSIIWYGYTNSKGYTYPDYTYSRTTYIDYSGTWEAGGISGNTITLRAPWPGPNLPAGAAVRNTWSGGTYKYNAASNVIVPNSWTRYEGYIGGLDTGGTQNTNLFPYGTSYIKLLFLINYHGVADNNIRWSDLEFTEISSRNLETATQSQPGVVSTSSQSFGGLKTFTDGIVSQSTGNSSFAGNVGIGETAPDYKLDVNGSFGFTPGSSVTPVDNGDVTISATNNTTLTFRLKGSDGTVRSGTLTLS